MVNNLNISLSERAGERIEPKTSLHATTASMQCVWVGHVIRLCRAVIFYWLWELANSLTAFMRLLKIGD